MRKFSLSTLAGLLFFITIYGQPIETDTASRNAINKLSFLIGNWQGDGWMMGRDGKKHTFKQTENIQFKLDNTAVLVEGRGIDGGKDIHNALAIIRYNKIDNNYSFNTFLSTGMGGTFKAELIDEKLYWYPNEMIRYIIYLNEKGQWYEKGEMKRGEDWFQFLEMTLDKK